MKALIGAGSMIAVESVSHVPTDGTPTSEIIKIAVQLVIGIISIFHLIKKPKNQQNQ